MNDKRVDAWRWTGPALCLGLAVAPIAMGAGGIQTDGSVGANGNWLGRPQALSGANVTISQEMGTTAGRNLFHSFSEFNVNRGQTVTFTGNSGLRNVISRVTGGSGSDIDGTLRSRVGTADVYLINPNGVTFGANARVDVPAAFHVGTADEVRFKDGARYSARNPNASTLSAAEPAAFGYLGTSAANNGLIKVDGAQLEVKPGQSLDLAAGEVRVEGGAALKAEAGEVRLTASRGKQEVSLERDGSGFLPLPEPIPSEQNAGKITVKDASVETQGDGSGKIGIWGGAATITNGFVVSDNTGAKDSVGGKGIDAKTGSLRIDNGAMASSTFNRGSAGHVNIETSGNIELMNGGVVAAATIRDMSEQTGSAGTIRIVSGGSISLDRLGSDSDTGVFATATPDSTGDAGRVDVVANGDLTVRSGALISTDTYGKGDAGRVALTVGGNLVVDRLASTRTTGILSQAEGGSEGDAGSVTISAAGNVDILNGGEIAASTFSFGKAGTLSLTTNGNLTVDGHDSDFFTGIASNANISSSKDAGNVYVFSKGNVDVRGGGEISSSAYASAAGNAGLVSVIAEGAVTIDSAGTRFFTGIGTQANPGSLGNAGNIIVQAGTDVAVLNGGKISSNSFALGHAGDVKVSAGRNLTVSGHGNRGASEISSEANGQGHAGNVAVESGNDVEVSNGGAISSSTSDEGNAGSVSVVAGNNLTINGEGVGAAITSSAESGSTGDAGSVEVMASHKLSVLDRGNISSTTAGAGHAGSVGVQAARVMVNDADISATSTGRDSSGQTGNVEVAATKQLTVRNGGAISIANEAVVSEPGALATGKVVVTAPKVEVKGGTVNASTSGNVVAGSIKINADRSLSVSHKGVITSSTSGAGSAGSVSINTADLRIDNSQITARAEAGSSGRTGGIRIGAGESLSMANHARISIENDAATSLSDPAANFPAKAGTIRIDSPDILMSDSEITTQSKGDINAGDIRLGFGPELTLANSSITTSAKTGDGGAIAVVGGGTLRLQNSRIRSSVTGKRGNGGDIALTAQNLVMETGLIEADAISGNGGNVTLDVQALIPSGNRINGRDVAAGDYLRHAAEAGDWRPGTFASNIIRAVSQTGLSGNISLTAPQLNLSGAIANLGNPAFDTAEVSPDACSAEPGSSLSVSGRGGLSPRPRDWLLY